MVIPAVYVSDFGDENGIHSWELARRNTNLCYIRADNYKKVVFIFRV